MEQKLYFAGVEAKNTPSLIESNNSSGYINYGEDNKFGDYLYNIYTKCSTEKAIIDSLTEFSSNFTLNEKDLYLEETINKCIFDYILFGGFALQVNTFQGNKKLKYIDFKNLRTNKDKDQFWYSQEWSRYKVKSINLPKYNPELIDQKSIFYFTGYNNRDGKVYPQPRYSGALEDMETSIEVSRFWKSSIQNNLNSSAIISFNNGIPSEEIQKEIERKINNKFTGTNNAGKTIITFNDSKDQSPEFIRLASDDFDTKYQALIDTIQQRIFTAFRWNKVLCGINVETGFNKTEFIDCYNLAYITVIYPIQKTIAKEFKKFDVDIDFQKLTIFDEGTGIENALI